MHSLPIQSFTPRFEGDLRVNREQFEQLAHGGKAEQVYRTRKALAKIDDAVAKHGEKIQQLPDNVALTLKPRWVFPGADPNNLEITISINGDPPVKEAITKWAIEPVGFFILRAGRKARKMLAFLEIPLKPTPPEKKTPEEKPEKSLD